MEESQVLALVGGGFLLATDGREGDVARTQRADDSQKETSFQGVVSAAEATNINQPMQQKKKRVRREKIELEYLRGELVKLEDELEQLKTRGHERRHRSGCSVSEDQLKRATAICLPTFGYRPIAPRDDVVSTPANQFTWQAIAERQFKERCRAQRQHHQLLAQLEAEAELGRQMQMLLRRRPSPKVGRFYLHTRYLFEIVGHADIFCVLTMRYCGCFDVQHLASLLAPKCARSPPCKNEDAVFMDQLARVEDALLHMEVMLRKPVFRDSTSSFVDAFMEKDTIAAGGMAFIMQSCVTLPFDVQVTGNALWRVLTSDSIKTRCYHHHTDNLVAQSFGMHYTSDTIDVDLRGQYTFRRFNDHNCIVIVWTALLEPVELNGTAFHGLQCQQTGWIRHCGQQAGAIKSTRSQSYSRVAIEVQDDMEERDLQAQVQALIDIARPAHESILAFCASMIEEMLVKEDWRQKPHAVKQSLRTYETFILSCEQRVDVTDNTLLTCAHIVISQQNGDGLYIQMRLSGRKYLETDRTVYVLRALIEPKDLRHRLPLGPAFRETHVRVVTANEHLSGTDITGGDATTIDTRVEVTHNEGDAWDGHLARSMWKQAIQARKVVIEDLLELAKAINPQFQGTPTSSDIVPSDTPAVFERLMTESHEVYTGIDEFLNARRQQRLSGNTFFEHSDVKILPFERHVVEQVVWRALGYRVIHRQTNFYRDHVEATDDTISSCAHLVIRYEDLGVYIQLRLAGRKYREENRTVIVMRALVEPKGLDNRTPLGLAFQETHVRVITPSVPDGGGPGIAATTVETHVSVTQHLHGNWTRQFWRNWSDDNIARSMWNQAITARMLVIEDQLFDEARQSRQ
ncbi:hypothetical protein BBJ28_00004082 [Nothophytophthora sp. Chile5]|nr:hypothetical protein BBJ28_00004082 [Nothophytophthora sp. Chile5]